MSRLKEYCTKAKELRDQVTTLFNEIDAKQEGVATAEQIEQIKSWNQEAEEVETSARKLEEQEALRAANTKGHQWLNEPVSRLPYPQGGDPATLLARAGNGPATKTLGDLFLEDGTFKSWKDLAMPGGTLAKTQQVTSPRVKVESSLKALITGGSATSGGAFINPDYRGLLDEGLFRRPMRIRDLMTILTTQSDLVDYVKIDTVTNAAAVVPETTEATRDHATTGVKPESSLATVSAQTPVKTIAHVMAVTRQAFADAPQLRQIVDEFLRYGLAEEVEDQVLAGDGTGDNFTGVLNTSGTQSQAFTTDLLTTYRKARTKVVVVGRAMPNAYVINPYDVEALDLEADNEQRYYFGGPREGGVPRLWGVPVVESEAMPQGTAVLADWRWAWIWDRMQTALYMTDSHKDWFARNLLALLAELRLAFAVVRPKAFIEIALS